MTPEQFATQVQERHALTGLHIFTSEDGWRVFGFRKHAKGYQASVESGEGKTISDAISNLNERLIEGPIHRSPATDNERG